MVDKSTMRKALLENGIRTRGMSDDQIRAEFDKLRGKPEPKPEPKPEQAKPEAKPEASGWLPPSQRPEAKPAPQAKPDVKANGIAGALQQAIEEALNGYQPQAQFDEQAIIDLIHTHSKAVERVEHDVNITRGEHKITVPSAHPLLPNLLDVHAMQENAFLVGPAGSGKTTLAAQAAEALGFEFHFTGAVTDKFELTGFVDANGTYHESPLYKAVTAFKRDKGGAVMLIDEMDGSVPNATLYLNAILENGIVAFPNGEEYQIDRDTVFFIGAGNTMGKGPDRQYVGRYPLDGAYLDRWLQIDIDYDISIELSMAESAWLQAGGTKDNLKTALDFAHEVVSFRRQLNDKKINALVTPRATRRGVKILAKGWGIAAARNELYKHLSADVLATMGIKS